MHATGPDGTAWNVTRRWAPWRPRLRSDDGTGTGDAAGQSVDLFDVGDPVALLFAAVAFVVVLVLMPFIFPVLVGLLEIIVLIVLLPIVVLWRVLGAGSWEVEVRPAHGRIFSGKPVHVETAGGWRTSRARIHDIVGEIQRGQKRWQAA